MTSLRVVGLGALTLRTAAQRVRLTHVSNRTTFAIAWHPSTRRISTHLSTPPDKVATPLVEVVKLDSLERRLCVHDDCTRLAAYGSRDDGIKRVCWEHTTEEYVNINDCQCS